jgi:hypothetical protein
MLNVVLRIQYWVCGAWTTVVVVGCFSHIRTCEICEIATLVISAQPTTFSARGGPDN